MSHGLGSSSSMGLTAMAWSFTRCNINVAYEIGKVAMNLNKSRVCFAPEVPYFVIAMVNIWKEPCQALLPCLLDTRNDALKVR